MKYYKLIVRGRDVCSPEGVPYRDRYSLDVFNQYKEVVRTFPKELSISEVLMLFADWFDETYPDFMKNGEYELEPP